MCKTIRQEGSPMRFYTKRHEYYCGVDLHARNLYICVLDREGEILVHRNMKSRPEAFLAAIAPYRLDLVVCAECVFTWYWLADLCSQEKIPFVLGHALYMKAIHGAKTKNDRIDAQKIAVLLRGGMLPQAYVYPAAMRSTRDLLRRRLHLVRLRAQLLTHIRNTHYQVNLAEPLGRLTPKANRDGVAERFQDESVRKSVDVDLTLLEYYDGVIGDLVRYIVQTAKKHDPNSLSFLQSMPGIGKILALTILYEIHDIHRFPRVQDFVSYARLVQCAKESGGKRTGTSGRKMGNAYLKWAFSEAAVLFLARNLSGQKFLKKLERRHGKGKALSVLAHKIGRATYFMMKRGTRFDHERFITH
jgi:transposase